MRIAQPQPRIGSSGVRVQSARLRAAAVAVPETFETYEDWSYSVAKRAIDAIVSGIALIVLSPLFLVLAILIKLEDGGSVFFSQTRVGKGGREFKFFKFRSMAIDAEAKRAALMTDSEIRFKLKHDPRITNIGRTLRRFSLDELPQLLNVFIGDMSLVGPRPPIPSEVARYSKRARRRLSVHQGLTCTWQVSGRSLIPFDEQVELDLKYICERSVAVDLTLLLMTIPAVLGGRGAY